MRKYRRIVFVAAVLALACIDASFGWAQIPGQPGAAAPPAVAPGAAPAAPPSGTPNLSGSSPATAPPAADTAPADRPVTAPPVVAAPTGTAPVPPSPVPPSTVPPNAPRLVRIGTNAVSGLYYPAGGAICRALTRLREASGVRCLVESTNGSTANVRGLRGGDLEFGIVQSDWQYYALQGSGAFKAAGPVKELRAVFSLYSESLTIVVRKDGGIATLEQIKGKRIAAGPGGSGQRILFDALIAAMGWRQQDAGTLSEASDGAAVAAFCGGTADVVVMLTHHPSAVAQEMVVRCNGTFLPISGPPAAKLLKDRPYYAAATIPADSYGGMTPATTTLGVRATLVTVERVPADIVYALVKSVFDNLDGFMAQHPGLAGLKREEMVKAALSAPLHEGAKRYFREKGLLP